MTTTFKDIVYITAYTTYIILAIVTLGLICFIFDNIFTYNPIHSMYEKFYGREIPLFKAESNGEDIRILIKQKFRPWREPRAHERHFSISLGAKTGHYNTNRSLQEKAIEEIYMVRKYFELKKYKEVPLVYNTDIFKSLTEGQDDEE